MRIGIYSRVSTAKQKDTGLSLEDQIKRGIDFCNKNNHTYQIFEDGGYSGDLPIDKRPGLNRLFELILSSPKEIDGVFVIDFDRLTRNEQEGFLIKNYFIQYEIELFDLSGRIVLTDETQELLVGIKILLSSFERKKIKVRVKRGLERSALMGRFGGGPVKPYGYTTGAEKILVIEPEEAKVVKMIYDLSLKGMGAKRIANLLNEKGIPTKRSTSKTGYLKVRGKNKTTFKWRDAVVYNILTNPLYKGERQYKDRIIQSPIIIEPEMFEAVQILLKKKNSFKDTTNKYFYLLKGLLFCARCGGRLYGRKREDLSDNQYVCTSQRYLKEFCGNRGVNIDNLNKWIWNSVMTLPDDFIKAMRAKNSDQQMKNRNKSIKMFQDELETLNEEGAVLIKQFGTKQNNRFAKKRLEEIELEVQKIEKTIEKLQIENIQTDKELAVVNFLKDKIKPYKTKDVSDLDKQEILRAIIDKISIFWNEKEFQHQIKIVYKFDRYSEILLTKEITQNYSRVGVIVKPSKMEETSYVEVISPSRRNMQLIEGTKELRLK